MHKSSIGVAAGLSLAVATGLAAPASAQIVQAPGAPLPGLCVYALSVLLGQSQAGQAANQKLAQIQQGVNAELKTARDQLIADDKALTAARASLKAADYQQRTGDLQKRARDLEALTRTRDNQLGRTRDDVVARIAKAALPLFNASLTAHHCAIVLDRGPVYSVNPAMDLTPEVIGKLNGVMTTIDVQLAAPPPAAPAG